LLAALEPAEVRAREVDTTAERVLGHVAQDVRQLEGEPELDRVLARGGVPVAEDLDAHEPHGAGHSIAVLLEVTLPGLVAIPLEIHLDTLDDRVEMLARDREALDRVGERDRDRVAGPAAVEGIQLLAPAREDPARVLRRPGLVGDVVGGAAE